MFLFVHLTTIVVYFITLFISVHQRRDKHFKIFAFKRFQSPGAGVHIRFKCSEPINRPSRTKNFETCTNWEHMNSLGVKTLDYGVTLYTDYYDDYENDGISTSFFGRFSKGS